MKILVTGATGSVGRLVVDELLKAGATDVRALSNKPEKAALPAEVEVVKGYVARPETVPAALPGVDAMYLAPTDEHITAEVLAMAEEAGCRRVVDLAGHVDWWIKISQAVEASNLGWTHLSPGEFMDNSLMWAEPIRTTGQVRDCYPNAAYSQVDVTDIAAVAAKALLEDGHEGRDYVLTGPDQLTRGEMIATIGSVLGRHIPFVEIPPEEMIAELQPEMGEDFAKEYVEGLAAMVKHPQAASPAYEEVFGHRGTTYREWVERNIDQFR